MEARRTLQSLPWPGIMRKTGCHSSRIQKARAGTLLGLLLLLSACAGPAGGSPPPAGTAQPLPPTAAPTQTASPPPGTPASPTPETPPASPAAGLTPFPLPALQFLDWVDEEAGWALSRDERRILLTLDAGRTWRYVTPSGLSIHSIFALDRLSAWASSGDPGPSRAPTMLYRTRDGGASWQAFEVPLPLGAVRFLDHENGWTFGSYMGCGAGSCFMEIYRTQDGGESWQVLPVQSPFGEQDPHPQTVRIRTGQEFSFNDAETIWLAGSIWANQDHGLNALLWVSRDAGLSWQELRLPLPDSAPGPAVPDYVSPPSFVSQEQAFLYAHYFQDSAGPSPQSWLVFFSSLDGGTTWTALPQALAVPSRSILLDFVTAADFFALCLEGLCRSKDGGQTWEAIQSGLPFDPLQNQTLLSLDFVSPQVGWALVSGMEGEQDLFQTTTGGLIWLRLQTFIN